MHPESAAGLHFALHHPDKFLAFFGSDGDTLHWRPSLWWLDGCGVFTMPQGTVACSIILCTYLADHGDNYSGEHPNADGWDSFVHWGRWQVGPAVKALALEREARQVGLRYLGDSLAGGPRIVRVGDADEPAADPQVGGGRDQSPRPLVARTPVLVQGRDPAAADLPGLRVHGGEPA